MTEHLWLVYAVLSAVMAALVSIFGKIGLQGLDADTATVIRAVIMALFLIAVMAVQRNFGHVGEILADRRALTFIILSGSAGAMSWLFYFAALKYGRVSQSGAGGQTQRGYCLDCRRRVSGREPVDAFRFRDCPDYGRNNYGGARIKSARNLHEKP